MGESLHGRAIGRPAARLREFVPATAAIIGSAATKSIAPAERALHRCASPGLAVSPRDSAPASVMDDDASSSLGAGEKPLQGFHIADCL